MAPSKQNLVKKKSRGIKNKPRFIPASHVWMCLPRKPYKVLRKLSSEQREMLHKYLFKGKTEFQFHPPRRDQLRDGQRLPQIKSLDNKQKYELVAVDGFKAGERLHKFDDPEFLRDSTTGAMRLGAAAKPLNGEQVRMVERWKDGDPSFLTMKNSVLSIGDDKLFAFSRYQINQSQYYKRTGHGSDANVVQLNINLFDSRRRKHFQRPSAASITNEIRNVILSQFSEAVTADARRPQFIVANNFLQTVSHNNFFWGEPILTGDGHHLWWLETLLSSRCPLMKESRPLSKTLLSRKPKLITAVTVLMIPDPESYYTQGKTNMDAILVTSTDTQIPEQALKERQRRIVGRTGFKTASHDFGNRVDSYFVSPSARVATGMKVVMEIELINEWGN